jgi:predicted acetyltransferase
MWKQCFPDDTDRFITFYFDRVYRNEETLVYEERGNPVASLQMIPYAIKTGSEVSSAAYISGAMTHPGFRGKGYMSRLLNESFEIMKAKRYDYTFLIPQEEWLFEFYGKQGYTQAFPETVLHLSSPLVPPEEPVLACDSLQALSGTLGTFWEIYSRFLYEKPGAVLKTEKQFAHILWDFFNSEGVLFAGEPGWAFTFRKGDQIILKEFFYRDQTAKQSFLQSIQWYYKLNKLVIFNVPDAPFLRCKGMIKRLNKTKEVIGGGYAGMMLD